MNKPIPRLRIVLFIAAFLAAASSTLLAQSVGDYGSVTSGNWSALSTWMQWNGTGWNTTPSSVPSGAVNVYINSGDTVTVDAVDSVSGTMVVSGYMRDVAGLKTTGAAVTFDNGSTYELAHDGGSSVPGIPTATWNPGSTCLITGNNGTVSSTTGYNASQDFYNLTLDAAMKSNKDLGMFNNTINGTLTINNTGSSRIYLTSPSAGSPNTITLKGDLVLTAGQFSTNGSGSAADITINSYGNIIATGGNFSMSRGSGPVVIWNSYGDSLSLSNATTQTSGSSDAFVFTKQGKQYINLNNVTYGGGSIPIQVDTGATLVMGTSAMGGDGSFAVDSGATLVCGDTTGIDGNIATTGTVTLSTGASYVYNGAVMQTTGTMLPSTVQGLTIENAAGVALSKPVQVKGTLSLMSGILMLDTNNVVATAVSGGSGTSYLSTDSTMSYLKVPNVGKTQVSFPVGTMAEGYSPVWIANTGTADTFSVAAFPDTLAAAGVGRVNVAWNVTEGVQGGANCAITLGWTASAENSTFAANRSNDAMIYLLTHTANTEAGSGNYSAQFSNQPYTVSRGGISSFGTFAVGNFTLTAVKEAGTVPAVFRLDQNFPNPFNPTTQIEFTVAKRGAASLKVYNILGQQVATLYSGIAQPGTKYNVEFNGGSLASGVYFGVLESLDGRQIRKMVLMK